MGAGGCPSSPILGAPLPHPRARLARHLRCAKAKSSASSDRTAPARARRSGCCSATCTRPPARHACSGSTSSATASRSAGGSATCLAASRCTTRSPANELLDYLAELSGRPPVRRADLCERLELSREHAASGWSATTRAACARRSASSRRLQHDPELAILDEPTEGLDPLMQRAFYDILDTLKAEGRTIFFSSHVLSEVERVCDRVAIIRRGRLVAMEDIAGLLARHKRNVDMRLHGAPPRLDGVAGVSSLESRDGRLTVPRRGRHRPVPRGDRRRADRRPDDRAGASRGSVPRVLRGRRAMNGALFRQTWRAQRLKLAVVSTALAIWGFLLPIDLRQVRLAVPRGAGERPVPAAVRQASAAATSSACRARSRSASSTRSRSS